MPRFFRKSKFRFLGRAGFTFQDGDLIYKINSEMLFDGPYNIAVFPDDIVEVSNPQRRLDKETKREIGAKAVAELERVGWKVDPSWQWRFT